MLLAVLSDLKFRQFQNQAAIQKQVLALSQQADVLQKQNGQLTDLLSKINTSDFREQVARQQLNYKKQGEIVYGFSDGQDQVQSSGQDQQTSANARKWWNYFFED